MTLWLNSFLSKKCCSEARRQTLDDTSECTVIVDEMTGIRDCSPERNRGRSNVAGNDYTMRIDFDSISVCQNVIIITRLNPLFIEGSRVVGQILPRSLRGISAESGLQPMDGDLINWPASKSYGIDKILQNCGLDLPEQLDIDSCNIGLRLDLQSTNCFPLGPWFRTGLNNFVPLQW